MQPTTSDKPHLCEVFRILTLWVFRKDMIGVFIRGPLGGRQHAKFRAWPTRQIPCVFNACIPVNARTQIPFALDTCPAGVARKASLERPLHGDQQLLNLFSHIKAATRRTKITTFFFLQRREASTNEARERVRDAGGRRGHHPCCELIASWPLLGYPSVSVFAVRKKASRNYGAGRVPSSNQR